MIISLTGFMGCGKSSVGRRLAELLGCRFADLDNVIEEREGRKIPEIFASDGEAEFRRMEKEALEHLLRGCGDVMQGQSLPSQAMGPSLCGQRGSTIPASHPHSHSKSNSSVLQTVVALGGGAVMQAECEETVHSETVCIYLRASVETLVDRLTGEAAGRPLLAGAAPGRSSNPSVMSSGSSVMSSGSSVMSSEVETSALRGRILELMSQRATTYERVAHLIVDTDGKTIDEIAEEIIRHPAVSKSSQKNSPIVPCTPTSKAH